MNENNESRVPATSVWIELDRLRAESRLAEDERVVYMLTRRRRRWIALALAFLVGATLAAIVVQPFRDTRTLLVQPAVYSACSDNTSAPGHNWTHGDPEVGFPPSNGYYYLKIDTSGCGTSVDGLTHLVLRVQANAEGPDLSHMTPIDPATARPAWGFELWNKAHDHLYACTGFYDHLGGHQSPGCTGSPLVANPGNAVVEFRFDGVLSPGQYQQRVANNYDAFLREHATFDVVPCSTCEPGVSTRALTPTHTPTPTATPTPTPTPTPQRITNVPCTVTLNGVQRSGTCSGTFTGS